MIGRVLAADHPADASILIRQQQRLHGAVARARRALAVGAWRAVIISSSSLEEGLDRVLEHGRGRPRDDAEEPIERPVAVVRARLAVGLHAVLDRPPPALAGVVVLGKRLGVAEYDRLHKPRKVVLRGFPDGVAAQRLVVVLVGAPAAPV